MMPAAEMQRAPVRVATQQPQPLHDGIETGSRMRLSVVPPDTRAADQLAHTMRLVKAARFNAATRLERKEAVSLFTQSMVALYFVGLAVWQAVYVGQIDDATNRLMTFVQLVSSVFTLILGLLEAMNDYKMKAHHLQNCALAVSELAQELMIARPSTPQEVQEYRRRYNEALRACPVNHARIDFLCAKLDDGNASQLQRFLLGARYVLDVYGLYALFLAVPPLIWWLHQ
ncbi:SLATT domain-containing protein [Hyphomicrobium sp. LHD-15]|uniref:SLATT domain-containing protein n=1 Tax=Hyphomicrobium sp. LHD-15 TaxID=3072142 RepID=UPI00280F8590|nr:SLATT domain-containing protein [Hyphomicrobium sp. LHD-15]MDQ8698760.1 SLATT domain-containing protein [Hyphomicrobium sp. LHD-15]